MERAGNTPAHCSAIMSLKPKVTPGPLFQKDSLNTHPHVKKKAYKKTQTGPGLLENVEAPVGIMDIKQMVVQIE